MNEERIRALAYFIAALPHCRGFSERTGGNEFCMAMARSIRRWDDGHGCGGGTIADIEGWATILWPGGTEALGLERRKRQKMCYPLVLPPGCEDFTDITPAMAARTLQHLANTGEVDWTTT